MKAVTIRMSDKDAVLVCKFAQFEGVAISDFPRAAVLEKIEDACELEELREAISKDDGARFSIDGVLDEL